MRTKKLLVLALVVFALAGATVTLAQYIDQQFHRRPVVGDFVHIGGMNLVVREMRDGRTTKVGIVVRNR